MPEPEENKGEDHLPGMNTATAWVKAIGILFALVLINLVVAFASWGWGVIITIPFTVYLAFLLLRDMIPRHRLPPGRQPPHGAAAA
jgi:hypothetical protein